MRLHFWIVALLLTVSLMGCRPPAVGALPTSPVPVPASTGSATPATIPTKPSTVTPRPHDVDVVAGDKPVNCRFGPGIIYAVIDELEPYQSAQAAGRDSTSQWWYLRNPNNPGGFCWVAASATDMDAQATSLPVVEPPFVTVNNLNVRAEPPRVTVKCDAFPQYILLVGEITTNGPTLVIWHWEVSTGEVTAAETLIFEGAETQVVQKWITVKSSNDYSAHLRVSAPNDVSIQVNFIANCTS